jgi:hypothetical protein
MFLTEKPKNSFMMIKQRLRRNPRRHIYEQK